MANERQSFFDLLITGFGIAAGAALFSWLRTGVTRYTYGDEDYAELEAGEAYEAESEELEW